MDEAGPHGSEPCSGLVLWTWNPHPSCRHRCRLEEAFPGPSAGQGRGGRGGSSRKQAGAAAWGGTGASLLGAVIWKPSAGREGGSCLPGATHTGWPRGDTAGQPVASLAHLGVPGSPRPGLALGSVSEPSRAAAGPLFGRYIPQSFGRRAAEIRPPASVIPSSAAIVPSVLPIPLVAWNHHCKARRRAGVQPPPP